MLEGSRGLLSHVLTGRVAEGLLVEVRSWWIGGAIKETDIVCLSLLMDF